MKQCRDISQLCRDIFCEKRWKSLSRRSRLMSRHNEELKAKIFFMIIGSYITTFIEENARRTVEECRDISKLCRDIYCEEGNKLCHDIKQS